MNYIKHFSKLTKTDANTAGGKGASLGEMTGAGIPVPGGFVLLASTFDYFLKETDLEQEIRAILNTVNTEAVHTVDKASKQIQALILNAKIPNDVAEEVKKKFKNLDSEYVAVRSSATAEDSADHAWAGQLDTFLNTTENTLLENVKRCWASLYTPRAIFYRFEKGLHTSHISVAVVIQQMVESEMSGIAFSVHPVTEEPNQMIIEAGLGLGEAIVSGAITPDSYVVSKKDNVIIDINVNEQTKALYRKSQQGENEWVELGEKGKEQVLTEAQIIELAALVKKIEEHYGCPQDIEWAAVNEPQRENGGPEPVEGPQLKFYITQSRPITTLSGNDDTNKSKNLFEFSWSERHSVISAESWLRGYISHKDIIGNDNKHVLMHVIGSTVHTYNKTDEHKTTYNNGRKLQNKLYFDQHLLESQTARDDFQKFYRKMQLLNLSQTSNLELQKLFKRYQNHYDLMWSYFKVSQPEYLEYFREQLLELLKAEFNTDFNSKFITLTTPDDFDIIKEEEIDALKLSIQGKLTRNDLDTHAQKYSWLFFNTYNHSVINNFLKNKFAVLDNISTSEKEKRIETIFNNQEKHKKEIASIISNISLDHQEEVAHLSLIFRSLAVDRLSLKSWWGGAEYLFLSFFEEIAKRIGIDVEKLLLTYSIYDIELFLNSAKKLSQSIRVSRKKEYLLELKDDDIVLFEEEKAKEIMSDLIYTHNSETQNSQSITGVSANHGIITGVARVVPVTDLKQLMKDLEAFQEGDIMVTTMTQPTMVSLAKKASAIVTDEGGITSHASILAREYGIPCIVGCHTATKIIKTGDNIKVNGDTGEVTIINSILSK